jgi:hypothetical protein
LNRRSSASIIGVAMIPSFSFLIAAFAALGLSMELRRRAATRDETNSYPRYPRARSRRQDRRF